MWKTNKGWIGDSALRCSLTNACKIQRKSALEVDDSVNQSPIIQPFSCDPVSKLTSVDRFCCKYVENQQGMGRWLCAAMQFDKCMQNSKKICSRSRWWGKSIAHYPAVLVRSCVEIDMSGQVLLHICGKPTRNGSVTLRYDAVWQMHAKFEENLL